MATPVVPTKANLIAIKRSLELARVGFDLIDRKRVILIREMMMLIKRAEEIQNSIDVTYSRAYAALQEANISLGICEELAAMVPIDDSLGISSRSVMGVEIPILYTNSSPQPVFPYGLQLSNAALDRAEREFLQVKSLTISLAEIENSVYRLADAIGKAQKRANALKNIVIPRFEENVRFIANALEEKDREDFSRLKVIKKRKS